MGGMELPLHQLNLTDDQKAQIKQMFQAEKPAMKPLMQQEHAAHAQMIQLITSGTFEQAKVAAVAAQESQVHMQMEIEHAKMASQICYRTKGGEKFNAIGSASRCFRTRYSLTQPDRHFSKAMPFIELRRVSAGPKCSGKSAKNL